MTQSPLIFRKGLNLKHEVAHVLAESYHSDLVARAKAADYRFESGRLSLYLARELGFCYGVERAVDYAYQTRKRFPDRTLFLTGEIIHNPHVNDQIRAQGIRFLSDPGESFDALTPNDVVILPAFGITVELLQSLVERGCTLVDTTCGSVLNVWKNVKRYSDEGFTSIIHGKYWHEETRATASQAHQSGRGHFLVVIDRSEATAVCDYIRNGGDRTAFLETFEQAISPGFDPDRDLARVGCANQTTMLSSESLEIGEMFKQAMVDRYGDAGTSPAIPRVRHDLQCNPGSPGRHPATARRAPARPDDRPRGLQQQQHLQSGPDLRRAGAHLSYRRSGRPGVEPTRFGTSQYTGSRKSQVGRGYRQVRLRLGLRLERPPPITLSRP